MGGFFANADANFPGRERTGGNYSTSNLENTSADIDPMDMSESMQEAMHRSNLDMRYALVCTWSLVFSSAKFLILSNLLEE